MFITFEGPDGSGKTTSLIKLERYLKDLKLDFILTREPGSSASKWNNELRQILLNSQETLSPMVEALIFSLDRRLHLEGLIWPALKANKLVICDRYLDSTLVYQGYATDEGVDKMLALQQIITNDTMPDLTIFFDINPTKASSRVTTRGRNDRIEDKDQTFKEKIYQGYLTLIKRFPQRFVIIDASQEADQVFASVKAIIESHVIK